MTLYSSVSGVRANQSRLDVIANNISNMNTVAFKSGDVRFSALFSQTLNGGSAPGGGLGGTNPQQVGSGVMVSEVATNFTQGGTQFTGRNTDLQISGNGFFVLDDGGGGYKLSRAGNFTLDSEGNMVAANGMKVRGTSQVNGTSTTTVENIYIPTEMQISKDLTAAGAIVGTFIGDAATPSAQWLPAALPLTAGAASRTTDTVRLVSFSIGNTGAITATYSNGDRFSVREDPNTTGGAASAVRLEMIHLPAEGGVLGSDNDGNGASNGASDLGRVQQRAGFEVFTAANGGTIMEGMNFSLQTVTVTNPMGLLYEGNNNYSLGANTGDAFFGTPGAENRGGVQSGALESSNVDMAAEFTNMIMSQRAIEANSRAITAQSQVLQAIIQIQ